MTRTGRDRKRRRGPESGATAVEFAMVAAPLFFMIFAILEVGMVFVASTIREKAVYDGARTIRTGELQQSVAGKGAVESEGDFIEQVCAQMSILSGRCDANTLYVDVQTRSGFSDNGAPNPVNSTTRTFDDSQLQFDPGEDQEIVLVRAFYKWPLLTPVMTQALSRVGGNTAILTATATFRNEPFGQIGTKP